MLRSRPFLLAAFALVLATAASAAPRRPGLLGDRAAPLAAAGPAARAKDVLRIAPSVLEDGVRPAVDFSVPQRNPSIYSYVDEAGRTHYVNRKDLLPRRYQDLAQPVTLFLGIAERR